MRINGKHIAKELLVELKDRIEKKEKQPMLAIIQIGNIQESSVYISEKKRVGEKIGVKVHHTKLPQTATVQKISNKIEQCNQNPDIHGIVVQLPLPPRLDTAAILRKIRPEKDVDGFLPNSSYTPPIAAAVLEILTAIYLKISARATKNQSSWRAGNFKKWLASQKISVIGRGRTGGGPIMETFNKLGVKHTLIHTQTKNPKQIMQNSDILISCVGKPKIVTAEKIKRGAILVSVGIHRGKDGKLRGDYNETEILDKAAFYTPTPGGIGPLTVACLVKNVINAASI